MLDTVIRAPFWTSVDEVPVVYPWLSKNEQCEVLIIGGGISAALAAYRFALGGVETTVVSRSPLGFGSTGTSMGIVEYDNGLSLAALGKSIGKADAVSCFKLFAESLRKVEEICLTLGESVDFSRRDSLRFTADEDDDTFHTEYLLRRHSGFAVEYVEQSDLRDRYSFPARSGINAKELAGELDPYAFTQALFARAADHSCRIYENAEITELDIHSSHVVCLCETGRTITANKVIMATGWEQNNYLKVLSGKRSAFTNATKPLQEIAGYDSRAILRDEDAHVRIRTTPENRLLISGQDSSVVGADGKIRNLLGSPKLAQFRHGQLEQYLSEMFYTAGEIDYDYHFSGTYGITPDGLPVIGEHPDYRNLYFNLPSGPDGILSAELASRQLFDLYRGERGGDGYRLFSPERKALVRRSMFA